MKEPKVITNGGEGYAKVPQRTINASNVSDVTKKFGAVLTDANAEMMSLAEVQQHFQQGNDQYRPSM
ncbi:hypothetical protein [Alteromonas antoniana]|uniref:hypothetical protein n=1 Tax=Alteromonas antoniana TaxID=2803813 RepID=UPI001C47F553|nr:hypothetical protein [Alteromonas antoniana]